MNSNKTAARVFDNLDDTTNTGTLNQLTEKPVAIQKITSSSQHIQDAVANRYASLKEAIMYDFEMQMKQANERHEEMVRELQLERQLPRKMHVNPFLNAVNAVNALKAVFAPKASALARTAIHSLVTK